MQDFRKLHVWQLSHELVLQLYDTTKKFPPAERFGLTAQLRRCAVSVPSNLAEGCGRSSRRDFARFIQIAFGSASELQYQLLLSRDLAYLDADTWKRYDGMVDEVKRMLFGLLDAVRE